MNLGIYCETLSPKQLDRPEILSLLGQFNVTLGHGIRFTESNGAFDPEGLLPYLAFGQKLKTAGGRYAIWPLLPKSMGYWINERNLDHVNALAETLIEGCRRFGAKPDLIVADIETPWQQMEKLFFAGPSIPSRLIQGILAYFGNRKPARFAWAATRLSQTVEMLRHELAPVSSAVFPFLIADLVTKGHMLQDVLEMPVFPVPFDAYNAMFYNSYIPKMAPMIIPPAGAPRAAFEYLTELKTHIGEKAWVTLGSTWEGVIPGNQGMHYTHPSQLTQDVAAVKAAGIETIWLYCLEGVLFADQKLTTRRSQKEARAYFEVMGDTPAATPAPHPGWTRGRKILEILVKDRLKGLYPWDDNKGR